MKTYVMDEEQASRTSVEVTTLPVTPTKASNDSRDDETHGEDKVDVVFVLPPHDLVLAQIADVRNTGFAARFQEHPADVRVPKSLMSVVRVEVGIGVSVVSAVATRPPLDRPLNRADASKGKNVL
jgi:hypothetical protein